MQNIQAQTELRGAVVNTHVSHPAELALSYPQVGSDANNFSYFPQYFNANALT